MLLSVHARQKHLLGGINTYPWLFKCCIIRHKGNLLNMIKNVFSEDTVEAFSQNKPLNKNVLFNLTIHHQRQSGQWKMRNRTVCLEQPNKSNDKLLKRTEWSMETQLWTYPWLPNSRRWLWEWILRSSFLRSWRRAVTHAFAPSLLLHLKRQNNIMFGTG